MIHKIRNKEMNRLLLKDETLKIVKVDQNRKHVGDVNDESMSNSFRIELFYLGRNELIQESLTFLY